MFEQETCLSLAQKHMLIREMSFGLFLLNNETITLKKLVRRRRSGGGSSTRSSLACSCCPSG